MAEQRFQGLVPKCGVSTPSLPPCMALGAVGGVHRPRAVVIALVTRGLHGRDLAGSRPRSESSDTIKMPILSPGPPWGALGADMKTLLGWNETPRDPGEIYCSRVRAFPVKATPARLPDGSREKSWRGKGDGDTTTQEADEVLGWPHVVIKPLYLHFPKGKAV